MSDQNGTRPAGHGIFEDSLGPIDQLLTTTRSVRRRLDLTRPVPRPVIEECLQLAIHAPNAEGRQLWRWLVLTDPERKEVVAEYLRGAWIGHLQRGEGNRRSRGVTPAARRRNIASAQHLVDNLANVPALIIPCMLRRPTSAADARRLEESWGDDPDARSPAKRASLVADSTYYGSIFPAIWSLQLALRSRGLGSTIITTHLVFHEFIAAELGIPTQATQLAVIPVAYTIGTDFQPARRIPATDVTIWNEWGHARGDARLRDTALAWIRDRNGAAASIQSARPANDEGIAAT
jgi:nitroreductase